MTSFWIMIVPFLFMVLLGLGILKIVKVLSHNIKIRWTPKHVFVVVTGYIALGLFAFLYLQFFYEPKVTILSNEKLKALEQVTAHSQKYYDENDASFLTEDYKKESWQFDFEGDALPIEVNEGNIGYNSDIRVRYNNDIKQGRVVLSYYQFPVVIEGIDMTDEVPPPHVYMNDQQLIINQARKHSVNYNRVQASLSILDFNRGNEETSEIISSRYSNVLLIEVARSTNVEDLQGLIYIIK